MKHYAEWIEKLSARKINNGLARENEMPRNRMQEAVNILESGISGRVQLRSKKAEGRKLQEKNDDS